MGIHLDVEKAFDSVNQQILPTKLNHYGISGNIYKWFQSYLRNRKQYNINCNNLNANINNINNGCVLKPLLFLL